MYTLRFRHILLCILLLLGTLLPTAAQEPVTIRVMTILSELTSEEIAAFEALNPDIKIEFTEMQDVLMDVAKTTGDFPDIFRVNAQVMPEYVSEGYLLDLTDHFLDDGISLDNLASATSYYRFNERYYGLPKDWSPDFTLWVNKASLEAANIPVPDSTQRLTYTELADIARQLTVWDGDTVVKPGLLLPNYLMTINQILIQHDSNMFNEDFTELQLTENPVALEAMRLFYDMSLEGSLNINWEPMNYAWGEGLPMVQWGYWYGGSIASDNPLREELILLPAPTWSHDLPNVDPTGGPVGMAIAANTEHPEEAYRFFEWYILGEKGEQRAASGWGAPPLLSMFEFLPQESEFNRQRFATLMGELPYSDWQMPIYPYQAIADTFNQSWMTNIELAIQGQIDFETFASNIQEEVNLAILNEQLGQ